MTEYRISSYYPARDRIVSADSADEAFRIAANGRQPVSFTRRWQRSPVAADRDNCHGQFNHQGTSGIAVQRADVIPAEAEHRNDVAVARDWCARGRALAELNAYGGYPSVTEADVAGAGAADIFDARDALTAAGYSA